MDHFIKKLQDKRQTPQRREQASHAVLLFLELLSSQKGLLIALSSEREKSAEERELKKNIPYDIRTIQQLLGHSDVETTMIYTHVAPSQTTKDAQSPLDFS